MASAKRVDALRLTAQEQEAILDELERSGQARAQVEVRRAQRYRYVVREGLEVQLDGTHTNFVVRPRNLSERGISFIHGSFMYPGAGCLIMLVNLAGEGVPTPARVVRCRCVHGRVHEVAAEFKAPIELGEFLDPDTARSIRGPGVEATKPSGAPGEAPPYPVADVVRLADQIRDAAVEGVTVEQLARLVRELGRALLSRG